MKNPIKMLFHEKSVALKWFFSYLFVLIIPLIFSLVIYHESEKIISGQLHDSTATMLKEMSETIDQQLDYVQKLSMQIAFDARVQLIVNSSEPESPIDLYTQHQTIQDFKIYKSTTPANYIHDFMIYLRDQNTVLSPLGKYRNDYVPIYYEQNDLTSADWNELITSKQNGFLSLPYGDSNLIVFRQTLPFRQLENPDAVIIIFLDDKKIMKMIESVHQLNQGIVYILNAENEIMLSSQDDQGSLFDLELMDGDTGLFYTDWKKDKYAVSYIKSQKYDWTYVTLIPESIFTEKLSYINKTTLISLVITLLLGLLMVFLLVRNQYKPIHSILSFLSKNGTDKNNYKKNEWTVIENALGDTLKENVVTKLRLQRQHKVIQSHLIERLMKGRMEKNYALDDLLQSLNIDFSSQNFMVIIIYVEDYQFNYGSNEMDEAKKWDLVRFVVSNIMGEMLDPFCAQVMVEIDDMLVGLLNFHKTEKNDLIQQKEEIFNTIYEAQNFLKKHFFIEFTVSMSGLHQTVESIPKGYEEALRAMEYKFLLGNSKVINYDNFREADTDYYYSMEQEQWLVNYIKAGDYSNAEKLIVELVERFATGKTTSIEILKCFMFDITSTIIKATDEIRLDREKSVLNQAINDLMNCKTIVEMKDQLIALLQKMTDFINEKKLNSNEELKNQILEYIAYQYQDMELSVASIAEHFNKDAVYISKYFREKNGEGILDVISKVRLKEAKRRLVETDQTIKEIGMQIGFLNSNTFIRTFKKYEGITPGKYRDSN